ncbi:hypothetical protein Ddye_031896 [Dipteronia dyeriana]|uniref:F-box domain-containing protein n=1 Tax=Dipteronia dyeriana TaxID=168575 RepID=A0AAD9TJ72_9ROSI|nr:hypothetical protein Ddye_031896 [Dipteronia dyeriana]
MTIDRLSNLPDAIIHEILSLLPIREAVKTCVLSKTWKYHWTHTHTLNLHLDKNFAYRNPEYLENFVLHVLRRRHPLCNLNRILLRYDHDYFIWNESKQLMNNLFDYALSQELQEFEADYVCDLPSSFFKCQTLKTLKLGLKYSFGMHTLLSKTIEFASLKTLKLDHANISDKNIHISSDQSLFSNFLNLENLELHDCCLDWRFKTFIINLPRLVNLIVSCFRCNVDIFEISTPRLKSFEFSDRYNSSRPPAVLNMDNCPILEHVKLVTCFNKWKEEHLSHRMSTAKRLSHAKSLTMSLEFAEPWAIITFTNAFDGEIKLEEQHKKQNYMLMIRQLKLLDINLLNESKVKNILEIIDNSEDIIDKPEEIEFDFERFITHGEYHPNIGFVYDIVLPKLLKYETLKALTMKGPYSFRILSSLSLGFKSLTTLKLSRASIESRNRKKKNILRSCDLFFDCFNLERLELSEFRIENLETLNIKAPRLLHLTISIYHWTCWGDYEHYHHQRDDQGANDRKIVIISAPRLKFFEFELSISVDTMQLRLENCSVLEEVNIRYALPLVVWRERYNWNQRYILDMMFTNDQSGSFNQHAPLLALKFSKVIMYAIIRF